MNLPKQLAKHALAILLTGGSLPSATANPTQTQKSQYGIWTHLPSDAIVTMDFIDSDQDGIDDRRQSGPGEPDISNLTGKPTQTQKPNLKKPLQLLNELLLKNDLKAAYYQTLQVEEETLNCLNPGQGKRKNRFSPLLEQIAETATQLKKSLKEENQPLALALLQKLKTLNQELEEANLPQ